MAKLKCDTHKRRVIALNGKFIHRGGWGDVCPSPQATIGDKTYTATQVEEHGVKGTPLLGRLKLLERMPKEE